MTTNRRKVTASLSIDQHAELEKLMKEDGQTNLTFFIAYLINQEKKKREQERNRKPVGRPKKDEDDEPEEDLWYPSPDGGTSLYTKDEWEAYYIYRNMQVPALPPPVKKG
jgi:hypothetical protein